MLEIWGEIMVNTNISPHFFWYEMTFEELNYIRQSLNNKEKNQWEMIRVLAYNNAMPYIDSKQKSSLTPTKFMPFPWDNETTNTKSDKEKLSKEEIQKRIEYYSNKNKDKE